MSFKYLSCRYSHSGPNSAKEIHRTTRTRHQLHVHVGRRGPRAHGFTRGLSTTQSPQFILYNSFIQVRSYQELVGRTDFLKVSETGNEKAKMLNLNMILQNALHMRPGVNIVGGSVAQDFQLEHRLDNVLIKNAQDVIDGKTKSVSIDLKITNECRAFGSTLSYYISK